MRRLGLDLGGTNIKLALLDGDAVADASSPRRRRARRTAARRRCSSASSSSRAPRARSTRSASRCRGSSTRDGRALLLPNLFGDWRGRAIRGPLGAALGRAGARWSTTATRSRSPSRALGAGRGADDVMCIVCGTGIGGGLVLGGRLHLGAEQRAGEIGHHTVVRRTAPSASAATTAASSSTPARGRSPQRPGGDFDEAVARGARRRRARDRGARARRRA